MTTLKSSQIDHIVVGPTGLFLVETKNWKFSDIETKSDKLVLSGETFQPWRSGSTAGGANARN